MSRMEQLEFHSGTAASLPPPSSGAAALILYVRLLSNVNAVSNGECTRVRRDTGREQNKDESMLFALGGATAPSTCLKGAGPDGRPKGPRGQRPAEEKLVGIGCRRDWPMARARDRLSVGSPIPGFSRFILSRPGWIRKWRGVWLAVGVGCPENATRTRSVGPRAACGL